MSPVNSVITTDLACAKCRKVIQKDEYIFTAMKYDRYDYLNRVPMFQAGLHALHVDCANPKLEANPTKLIAIDGEVGKIDGE